MWQRARRALEAAESLVLIGYSLPVTDLTVRSLVAGATTRTVQIVDPAASDVGERLGSLFGDAVAFSNFDSVEEFVSAEADSFMVDQSARLVAAWDGDVRTPVLVALSGAQWAPITAIQPTASGIELTAAAWFDSHNEATSILAPSGVTAGELLDLARHGLALAVRSSDGRRRLIYDVTTHRVGSGRSNSWLLLRCQG